MFKWWPNRRGIHFSFFSKLFHERTRQSENGMNKIKDKALQLKVETSEITQQEYAINLRLSRDFVHVIFIESIKCSNSYSIKHLWKVQYFVMSKKVEILISEVKKSKSNIAAEVHKNIRLKVLKYFSLINT